mgnify:CR=1 FL=1
MLASEMSRLEALQCKHTQEKERMARDGEARVWLDGGINNPNSPQPTVITIYGELSGYDRQCLLMLAKQIDRSPVTAKEGE